ncbi:ATP-binding cassette domain-containing protein [Streptomyces reniochalinae]|uniref:ATP-binding cassette domain-containing protein n=1 Tax=Streptomyces reniochalinae TaxID=2250578 RepID=A0A367EX32_9ACTN|nr:ATP-binding cassette domain-containing protein [Streptomyces reniochalinae]RCG22259.1 ATP-binding cassette domain-containing protein [Streptomyces reniochalinae]
MSDPWDSPVAPLSARRGRHRRDPAPVRAGLVRAGLRFLRRRPGALWALAGWSVLEAAHTFALGFALARALDAGFLAGRPATGLWWLAAAGLGLLVGALGTARVYRQVAALAEPLRDTLVHRVVERGLCEAVSATVAPGRGSGDAGTSSVSRLTHQVEIARDSFAGVVMVSRSFAVTLAGTLAGLAALAPPLLLVVLPPLAAGLAVFAVTLRPLARRQRDFLVADEELATEAGSVVRALRDVAACGARQTVRGALRRRVDAERRAADALAYWGIARAVALGLGGRLPLVLLLALAPWLLRHGVSAGELAGALTYLTQALLPALQGLVHGLGGAGARLAVVIGRLRQGTVDPAAAGPAAPTASAQAPAPAEHGALTGPGGTARPPRGTPAGRSPSRVPAPRGFGGAPPALALRDVSFAYGPAARPVLCGLDLEVPAGGHLAVVGPSGAGKSTLALLAAGLLRPSHGEVRLSARTASATADGVLPVEQRVLIPQESYVFTGSVRENLSCLLPAHCPPPDAALSSAVEAVGAQALVRRLGGLAGHVEAAALSAGERQQVALARAYLSPAPLAVLDEAGSHLDPAAEERAESAFAQRGGTLVVIAHRISSALRADRVLVLDGPRTRCGTHRELLACSPLYRDLTAGWAPHPLAAERQTAGEGRTG